MALYFEGRNSRYLSRSPPSPRSTPLQPLSSFTEHHELLFSCEKSALPMSSEAGLDDKPHRATFTPQTRDKDHQPAQGSQLQPSHDPISAFANRLYTRIAICERTEPLHSHPRSNRTAASSRPVDSEMPLPSQLFPYLRIFYHTIENVFHNTLEIYRVHNRRASPCE